MEENRARAGGNRDFKGITVGGYRADQVLAISDFEQSPSDGFDELGAEVWCVSRECLNNS